MHHENELSDELRAELEKVKQSFGPTGKFPGGKLTSNDEGEIEFGVTAYHGKVIVNFGKPIASIGMSPDHARELALSLRKRANEIERTPGL